MHTIYAEIDPVNHPVIVTARPYIEDYAHDVEKANGTYTDRIQQAARIARVDQLADGDRILAVWEEPADGSRLIACEHPTDTYLAVRPRRWNAWADCGCPGCATKAAASCPIVITSGYPWGACDIRDGGTYTLIVPAGS